MSTANDFSSKVTSTLSEKKQSVISFFIVGATSTLNLVTSRHLFNCPEYAHRQYGLVFLIGPAVILALITILVSFGTINTLKGICRKDANESVDAHLRKRHRNWRFVARKASLAVGYSLVSFLSWIVLTLLTTNTYSCIMNGPMPEEKRKIGSYMVKRDKAIAQSRIAGIVFLIICLSIAMVMHFIVKCRLSDPEKKALASKRRYDELEALAANKAFTAHLEAVATFNGIKIAHEALGAKQCQLHCHDNDECTLDGFSTISSERIENVRQFLARRYPRLDNEANTTLPYLNDNERWEKFIASSNTDQRKLETEADNDFELESLIKTSVA